MRPMPDASDRSPVKIAGWLMVMIGVFGLAGYAAGFVYRGDVPAVLGYAHVGASVIELSLAYGIFQRRRAAWSFGVALESTMTVVNLLGLAQTLEAGAIGTASAAVVTARLVAMVLLIAGSKQFK